MDSEVKEEEEEEEAKAEEDSIEDKEDLIEVMTTINFKIIKL